MNPLRFPSVALAFALCAPIHAQYCGTVAPGLNVPGVDGQVTASIVWDDGSGPSLYIGGTFSAVGGIPAASVARWNGTTWSSTGANMTTFLGGPGAVWAFAVHGGSLYAAGVFATAGGVPAANIARFDGTSWAPLPGGGTDGEVHALASYQGQLYVGGFFSNSGGVSTPRVARFDGAAWSYPAGGPYNSTVRALTVWDSGSGPKLYAGGGFVRLGSPSGPFANGVARYDGSAWEPLGAGTQNAAGTATGVVAAFETFDAGAGPRLYVGGTFERAGGLPVSNIASWNGSSWSAEPGVLGHVASLAVHDDGSGPRLCAAGHFAPISGGMTVNVARLDSGVWTALAGGVGDVGRTLSSYQGTLFVGGSFSTAGGAEANAIARLTGGGTWSAVASGAGLPSAVKTFCIFDSGAGPELYAGIERTAGVPPGAPRFRRWNGTGWSSPGLGLVDDREVAASAVWDDGSGPALYVAGTFSAIGGVAAQGFARWDGQSWSAPSALPSGTIRKLRTLDDGTGPALYAVNVLLNPTQHGIPSGQYLARWTGSAWQPLGAAFAPEVLDAAVYDSGFGARIHAVGTFTTIGGAQVRYVARWNATTSSWESLGLFDNPVSAIHVHDDGGGARLYVGGYFSNVGGVMANHVARWNGSTWSAVGSGLGTGLQNVEDFVVHDDGFGRRLYATGNFDLGSQRGLAAWDGSSWTGIASLNSSAAGTLESAGRSLASFDDGSGRGPALWLGGDMRRVDATAVSNVARIEGCHGTGASFCAGDGSAAPCPCGNESAPGSGSGCMSSVGLGGRLEAVGVASVSADTYVLSGSSMPGTSSSLYFSGTAAVNAGAGQAFGDGLRCVGGTVQRLGVTANVAGASSQPNVAQPTPLSVRDPVLPGTSRTYQVWYRNAAPYCTPAAFNLTNGWRVVWTQ
ncbi:MAG: hypothetical protein JNK02_05480 [Planctomycetes bacterium]|nr:hypothetical protein [Planctomycetota bacterium]